MSFVVVVFFSFCFFHIICLPEKKNYIYVCLHVYSMIFLSNNRKHQSLVSPRAIYGGFIGLLLPWKYHVFFRFGTSTWILNSIGSYMIDLSAYFFWFSKHNLNTSSTVGATLVNSFFVFFWKETRMRRKSCYSCSLMSEEKENAFVWNL